MTTIYKAVPKETEINIQYLNENIRFVGEDVESIDINETKYGQCVIIEDAPLLNKINLRKPGTVVCFNSFPEKSVRINGPFEEIRVHDKNEHYAIHRFGSSPTLALENVWGAVVTKDPNSDCSNCDALLFKCDNLEQLRLSEELSHVTIIGDRSLKSVEIEGQRIIRNLAVHGAPNLNSLSIKKRILTCSIKHCPSIDTIIGYGDRLDIYPIPKRKGQLSIGGFWHEVPDWYNLQIALLQIPHFKAHLTAQEIIDCDDLGGVKLVPYSYDGRGGLIDFSERLGMEIEEVSAGIDIIRFIQIIENGDAKEFSLLQSWCSTTLNWFDQYKVMRILASLASRGYDTNRVLTLRKRILEMNTNMPKLIIGSVNDGNTGGKWNPLYCGESDSWEIPSNSVMPFGRLDLEVWLNTDIGMEFLGIDANKQVYTRRFLTSRHLGENGVIRNLLTTTLSAANSAGRNNDAEDKLTALAESLYTNTLINSDPFCCEFTVYHLSVSRIATKSIIKTLIEGITGMPAAAWKRCALLIGVVHITNSSRARMELKRLASDKGLSFEESSLISTVSVAGQRAFESGKVAEPTWPYLKSWQQQYKR